jgi:plasmid stabilization system protein ParE
MKRFILTPSAERDVNDIWDYMPSIVRKQPTVFWTL